jgi:hypothetical protein
MWFWVCTFKRRIRERKEKNNKEFILILQVMDINSINNEGKV